MNELMLSGDTPRTLEIVGINMKGEKGDTPEKGVDYYTEAEKEELVAEVSGTVTERFADSANALKGEASGESVLMSDVSPLEHDILVRLSSGTVADFSDVEVLVQGKNIYDEKTRMGDYLSGNEYTLSNETLFHTKYNFSKEELGKTFTFSVLCKIDDDATLTAVYIAAFSNGEQIMDFNTMRVLRGEGYKRIYLTLTPYLTSDFVELTYGSGKGNICAKEFQLEEGTAPTEYEEYAESVRYNPSRAGEVRVRSIYPSTAIKTNNDDVTISAEYNRDTNKVIENLENAILALGGNV